MSSDIGSRSRWQRQGHCARTIREAGKTHPDQQSSRNRAVVSEQGSLPSTEPSCVVDCKWQGRESTEPTHDQRGGLRETKNPWRVSRLTSDHASPPSGRRDLDDVWTSAGGCVSWGRHLEQDGRGGLTRRSRDLDATSGTSAICSELAHTTRQHSQSSSKFRIRG